MGNRRLLPVILPLVFISLLAGIWAGWIRIGWEYPLTVVAGRHGALMVGSFLGTLISLERAVVVKSKWVMLAPFLSGLSFVFFVIGADQLAFWMLTLGSFGQVLMMYSFLNRYKELYLGIMLAGSLCWFVGNVMWLVWTSYPLAAPWWIAFLLLIITGERLELTRFLPIRESHKSGLIAALVVFMMGIIIPFHGNGRYIAAVGLILVGAWLLRYDMATKSVKRKGQHKFSAVLLLMGYGWMIVSGCLMLAGDIYGFIYDAVLHSFFIGFVFSMIFAHGPVILPGVIGIQIKPYHKILYLPAMVLQVSLIVRIVSDIFALDEWRRWAGMWNGIAILLFFMMMGLLIVKARKDWPRSHEDTKEEKKGLERNMRLGLQ